MPSRTAVTLFLRRKDAIVLYEEVLDMMESVRDQIIAPARGGDYRARSDLVVPQLNS